MDASNPTVSMLTNIIIVVAILWALFKIISIRRKSKKLKATAGKQTVRKGIKKDDMANKTLAAIIVTALTAYGCKNFEIKSIRKIN